MRIRPNPYSVFVGGGVLCRERLEPVLTPGSHGIVVTSAKVMRLHGASLLRTLKDASFEIRSVVVLEDGEKAKTTGEWERASRIMAQALLDRSSFVIAFGGGSIGDAAGFAAATYMRGIRFVQPGPTPLRTGVTDGARAI